MNCKIITFPSFDRELKQLAKRYKSLQQDLLKLIAELAANPKLGADLGNGFRKVRLAIKSKSSGKRGGARVHAYHLAFYRRDRNWSALHL